MFVGDAGELAKDERILAEYAGKCDLIFFSPPYSLQREKAYKNKQADEYVEWLTSFAAPLCALLSPTGSIVIEVGNAWNPGSPTMSTAPIEALLSFKKAGNLHLCQELVWHNPARLPSPAQWVNVERARLKDSFTRIWWMSRTDRPKADNRRVLLPYTKSMRSLLNKQKYNGGRRPSEHLIGQTSFLTDNGGAISPAVLSEHLLDSVISMSNTRVDHAYRDYCRENGLTQHPARMPDKLAEFFISFLTDPGDLVLDPFAGTNTTGAAAHALDRQWLSFELNEDYAAGSWGRFVASVLGSEDAVGKKQGTPSTSAK